MTKQALTLWTIAGSHFSVQKEQQNTCYLNKNKWAVTEMTNVYFPKQETSSLLRKTIYDQVICVIVCTASNIIRIIVTRSSYWSDRGRIYVFRRWREIPTEHDRNKNIIDRIPNSEKSNLSCKCYLVRYNSWCRKNWVKSDLMEFPCWLIPQRR